ncbi:DegT/DnrJ/EryC1/StrS aminotransferase family protein [Candidatus Nitrosarchaeum limnium BG20]|uniref:DegT/DnrJ/EryC1/StrS aminotransferase family protein n=2 Tax=Nitrosarchaeum TaxID=1007082 RepID=S2ESJ3_9ARCH|nr:DegT/DnrJ/EryC1/StrS aminotransferase family protein [Candidatus Nitrosarchaeum limnium BG20]
MESDWYSQGPLTKKFEDDLSTYLNSNVSVVNNGTSAILCALLANNFKSGDRVLVPDFTFFATLSAPKFLGAKVMTADVDPTTFNISPEQVEEIVKSNDIKFVIVVDIAGLPIDIDAFEDLAKKYKFTLIEDAAQALGSEYKNKKVGSFNHTTTFSFHIAKQITTIEGGCVSSNDENISKRIKQLRDHGRIDTKNYIHNIIGSNFRITDLQSSIGIEQLKKIEIYILQRNAISKKYKDKIKNVGFQQNPTYSIKHSNMMFFTVYPNKTIRDKNFKILHENGVDAKLPWPPLHSQPANSELNKNIHENTRIISDTALMLPIFNGMTDEEADYVIECCNNINLKS